MQTSRAYSTEGCPAALTKTLGGDKSGASEIHDLPAVELVNIRMETGVRPVVSQPDDTILDRTVACDQASPESAGKNISSLGLGAAKDRAPRSPTSLAA